MSYKTDLTQNNEALQALLTRVENLPSKQEFLQNSTFKVSNDGLVTVTVDGGASVSYQITNAEEVKY